jgi:hypothetical protein
MAPLLEPAECCVLLVDPRKQHITHLGDLAQQHLSSSLMLLARAVHTARVPPHLAFVAAVPDPDQWLVDVAQLAPARTHVLGDSGSS